MGMSGEDICNGEKSLMKYLSSSVSKTVLTTGHYLRGLFNVILSIYLVIYEGNKAVEMYEARGR